MRTINSSRLSPDECIGIQINGLKHCSAIECKWQGISACQGQNILLTGKNNKGFEIGPDGLIDDSADSKNQKHNIF